MRAAAALVADGGARDGDAALEAGGGGDCLFHSVAAALVAMVDRDPDARRHVLKRMPDAALDLANKVSG